MYFMSNIFLKDMINEVHVTQFKLDYIYNTTHISHKNVCKLCREIHHMWWVNQDM